MKRTITVVLAVLAAIAFVVFAASAAKAEIQSEPWACFARGYIMDLSSVVQPSSGAVQPRSVRGRIQAPQAGTETLYSFALYDIAQNEWGMYLNYLIHVTDVDEGFSAMLAKAAGGEFPVELVSYGGKCPKEGRSLRGANTIRLLDYDLEPRPASPTDGGGRG